LHADEQSANDAIPQAVELPSHFVAQLSFHRMRNYYTAVAAAAAGAKTTLTTSVLKTSHRHRDASNMTKQQQQQQHYRDSGRRDRTQTKLSKASFGNSGRSHRERFVGV